MSGDLSFGFNWGGPTVSGGVEELAGLLPAKISECAITVDPNQGHCSAPTVIENIARHLGINKSGAEAVREAAAKLGCDGSEKCVIQKMGHYLGEQKVRGELGRAFKIEGPTDTTLLNNVNIDTILRQWQMCFPQFYAYNFNMLDYHYFSFRNGQVLEQPDSLATVTWADIKASGATCAGCIINSDQYSGGGKHWMALFLDARDPANTSVEFFNSSGNGPAPEWISWLGKMQGQLTADGYKSSVGLPRIIRSSRIKHQKSKSECGLYSLFYIWSRIAGTPPEKWEERRVPDQAMFEFRYHLFEQKGQERLTCFDYQKFQRETDIKWE